MERIDGIVGNRYDDPRLGRRIDEHDRAATLEVVRIEAGNRKRSRLRVETDRGTDLGVVLDEPLRAGDVLAINEERAIVVQFERRDAVVIDLPEATTAGIDVAVELGHRIGNQHWDLAVEDGSIYVPVEADRHIIENVLAETLPEGAAIEYEAVDPALWLSDDSAGDRADHSHGGDGHSHGAAGSHTHESNSVNYRDIQKEAASSDTAEDERDE